MLNKKPIFIVGFQHGGTNVILNLLRSHPEVCSPRGETQEVFKGKRLHNRFNEPMTVVISKILRYLPILAEQKQDIFSLNLWEERKALTRRTERYIDRILLSEKLKAKGDTQNRFRTEDVEYTHKQILESRLLCKNLNGLIYLTKNFNQMYPDATFIALVRNGYALCEGHVRRGADLETTAKHYEKGCQKIINDAKNMPNYHIFRFEDFLKSPREVFDQIIECTGLDAEQIKKLRLENKRIIDKNGKHTYMYEQNREGLIWYPVEKFMEHIKSEVNEHQIKNLTLDQKQLINSLASSSLEHFSYSASI